MGSLLYTIGYAGFPDFGEFVSILKEYGITTLIDIRRRPYQAYYEQYEGNTLRNALTREEIAYIRFEYDFGMMPDEDTDADSPLDFEETAKTEGFEKGISRIVFGMEKGLVPVIMGEAADPAMCARGLLIARALHEMGYTVKHILPGGIKDHSELEKEIREFARNGISAEETGEYQMSLISPSGSEDPSMSDDELLAEGYRKLNSLIF